jgi:hypothetical protein
MAAVKICIISTVFKWNSMDFKSWEGVFFEEKKEKILNN